MTDEDTDELAPASGTPPPRFGNADEESSPEGASSVSEGEPPAPFVDPSATYELVEQASAGDAAAWEALYKRYRRALRAILKSQMREMPRTRFDTEDVLQSTFLSAYTALDGFTYQGPESFRKWLTSILMHKLFDKLRHNVRDQRDVNREAAGPAEIDELPDEHDSPSMEIARFEGQAKLLTALAELSIEDQDLLTLRFFERRTWPEVAAALGVVEATARRRLPQALERLTHRLRES